MEIESFGIAEFFGILLVGFPVLVFFAFILLEFVAQMRYRFK